MVSYLYLRYAASWMGASDYSSPGTCSCRRGLLPFCCLKTPCFVSWHVGSLALLSGQLTGSDIWRTDDTSSKPPIELVRRAQTHLGLSAAVPQVPTSRTTGPVRVACVRTLRH